GDRGWITLVGLSRDRQIDMSQAQRRIDNAISRRRGPPLTSQDLLEDAACFPLKHFLQRSADRQGLPLAAGVLIGELRLCDTGVGSKLDGQREIVSDGRVVSIRKERAARQRRNTQPRDNP